MPTFTAEQAGALSDGATFGNTSPGTKGLDWPGETDDVDVAGYALTQGTATGVGSLTDLVTGGGTLTLTGSFSCPDVQEVEIVVPDTVTATISFGTAGVDPGCAYSGTGYAIDCQFGGTVTDVTGDVENSGAGYAVLSYGTFTDFSGTLTNSGNYGVDKEGGSWGDFSGTLNNTGIGTGVGNWLGDAWTDFSGTLTNSGAGYGVYNSGTFTNFSGACLDSGSGVAFYNNGGSIENVTGIIGRPSSQADLVAENIVAGKTILGVVGTWDYPQTTTLAVALRAAVGMSTANLDTQLAALPTAAENAAEAESVLAAAHGAGGWETITAADVRSAVGLASANLDTQLSALSSYGPGDGDTAVDHNTGGTDTLRYTYGGVGIDNGTIRAYLKSDYDAGTYTLRSQTVTGSDGRWAKPMYLNSGLTYTLTFEKAGAYGVTEQEVTIP